MFAAIGDRDGLFGGRVECQCARAAAGMAAGMENVFYESRPRVDTAPERGRRVKLTFIWAGNWSHTAAFGKLPSGCAARAACNYSDTRHEELMKLEEAWVHGNRAAFDWAGPLDELLSLGKSPSFATSLAPDADLAFFNRGLWGPLPAASEAIFKGLQRLTHRNGGRCFGKGTTHSNPERNPTRRQWNDLGRTQAVQAGCELYDLWPVTERFSSMDYVPTAGGTQGERESVYWDAVHFQPWVYTELNNLLLNQVCGQPPQRTRGMRRAHNTTWTLTRPRGRATKRRETRL